MKVNRASKAMRLFFTTTGLVIWAGIYLTGFSTVHWLLYLPAAFMIFAAVTGICPGLIISYFLTGEEDQFPKG